MERIDACAAARSGATPRSGSAACGRPQEVGRQARQQRPAEGRRMPGRARRAVTALCQRGCERRRQHRAAEAPARRRHGNGRPEAQARTQGVDEVGQLPRGSFDERHGHGVPVLAPRAPRRAPATRPARAEAAAARSAAPARRACRARRAPRARRSRAGCRARGRRRPGRRPAGRLRPGRNRSPRRRAACPSPRSAPRARCRPCPRPSSRCRRAPARPRRPGAPLRGRAGRRCTCGSARARTPRPPGGRALRPRRGSRRRRATPGPTRARRLRRPPPPPPSRAPPRGPGARTPRRAPAGRNHRSQRVEAHHAAAVDGHHAGLAAAAVDAYVEAQGGLRYTRRKISAAFCPPKAKFWLSATSTRFSRGSLGM